MRRDRLYLTDVVDATAAVARWNIAVHAYFSVDWAIVWTTATGDVPTLRAQVSAVLAALPPDDDG